jgi:hypothetical protein
LENLKEGLPGQGTEVHKVMFRKLQVQNTALKLASIARVKIEKK